MLHGPLMKSDAVLESQINPTHRIATPEGFHSGGPMAVDDEPFDVEEYLENTSISLTVRSEGFLNILVFPLIARRALEMYE